ncbi:protein LTO1 homolog isoform X2 [Amblyomma americanum]
MEFQRPRAYPKPRHSNSEEGPAPVDQRYRQMGFTRGFSLGEEVGWRDGYQLGLQRGAQIATELGFYQGFVHAWITVLEREEIAKQRKMVALKALLEMTKNFPQVNIADEDMFEKLHKIRAKFKQVVSILNINTQESELHPEGEPSSPRPEMSF